MFSFPGRPNVIVKTEKEKGLLQGKRGHKND
jgi:hypothetical protein